MGASPLTAGFILGGTSAGANISAALSVKARDTFFSPPLTGIALLIPGVMDHTEPLPKFDSQLISMVQNADAPILGAAHVEKFEIAYAADPKSPLYNVLGCAVLENLPRTFSQICGLDPLRDEGLVYMQELKKNGVETVVKVYDGVCHGFWTSFPHWEKSKGFIRDTVEGMKWLLNVKNGE